MKEDGRFRALETTLTSIQKRYGEGAIMRLGQADHLQVETIPTGSLALDLALGVGGIPRGRVTEIFGPEMTGKSTLALHIIAEAQRADGLAAYIDVEHALDPTYASDLGVKVQGPKLIIRTRAAFLLAYICQAMIGERIIAWGRGHDKGRLALSGTRQGLLQVAGRGSPRPAADRCRSRLAQVGNQCLPDDLDEDDRHQRGDVDHSDAGDDVAHGRQNGLGDLV